MAEIDIKRLMELLVGKRIVSLDTDCPVSDRDCEEVKITTDDGSVVVLKAGKDRGWAFMCFTQETEPDHK